MPPPRLHAPTAPRLLLGALAVATAVTGLLLFPTKPAVAPPPQPSPATTPALIPHATHPPAPPSVPAAATPASPFAEAFALAERGLFSDAVRTAQTLPADQRTPALVSVFSIWAHHAPAEAANRALSHPDDAERNLAWHAIATAWAADAPADLATFAWSLADETPRAAAFAAALPAWLERDEPAALAWIGALPASPRTDSAVAIVARHSPLIERDPALAISWAEVIQDPALRSRTLGQVLRVWLPVDPDAAGRYARSSPELFPSEREDVLVGERFTAHP